MCKKKFEGASLYGLCMLCLVRKQYFAFQEDQIMLRTNVHKFLSKEQSNKHKLWFIDWDFVWVVISETHHEVCKLHL